MAEKNKKKDTELITSCDDRQLAIANRDLKDINIESLIHTIRGQRVMFDRLSVISTVFLMTLCSNLQKRNGML